MGSEWREPPERHRATLATESVASKSERSAREGAEESISSWRRARTSKSACGSLMVVKVGRRVVLCRSARGSLCCATTPPRLCGGPAISRAICQAMSVAAAATLELDDTIQRLEHSIP